MGDPEDKKPKEPNVLDSIRELQELEPFQPFEIVVASGDRYRIEVSNNLVIQESQLFYAFPASDRFALLRSNQIVAVEYADAKKSA